MAEERNVAKLVLTCLDAGQCTIAFEVSLVEGETITVEVRGRGTGVVEVSYRPDGLSIGAWSGGETVAWDRVGRRLSI